MRRLFVRLHRWFGLFTALFLFVAGLTGAVISWDHELDEWLNPAFFVARDEASQPLQSPLELVTSLERENPNLRATYFNLAVEQGRALQVFVEGKTDPSTGQPFELGFNQVAIDPVSGQTQAQRTWGDVSLQRENVLSFLYRLHYSLHLPKAWGIELGIVFMGIVGIVWMVDCAIALYVAFPNVKLWRRSFRVRWRNGGDKLNFDLHRSGGVWAWLLLLMVAVTSVSMNLGDYVVRPVVGLFSPLSPAPFDRPALEPAQQAALEGKLIDRAHMIERARARAQELGFAAPLGSFYHGSAYGLYAVGFFAPGQDHGDGGLGNAWLYFDATTGKEVTKVVPGTGSLGDLFMQAQFPLHSGRIAGIYGRVAISLLGMVVAMLSATGLVLWAKRRWRTVLAARPRRAVAGTRSTGEHPTLNPVTVLDSARARSATYRRNGG